MNISAYILLGVVAFLILKLLLPNASKRFLKLQASLPTSKIRSIAKGLAEVQGKLLMKKPLFSPINMTSCIGYYYVIEKIDENKKGHNSYSTIHEETQCNPFEIEDTTGKIEVAPEGIQLFLRENTHQYTSGGKRYTESLLREGDEVLLIGYADAKEGVPFLRKDDRYNLLGITLVSSINLWNKFLPLLRSFLFTCAIIVSLIIFILLQ